MALEPTGVYELRADPALEATLEIYAGIVDHVARYDEGALVNAAMSYCMAATAPQISGNHDNADYQAINHPPEWPFRKSAWQPISPRADLIKAAAMLIAEVKRMDDAAGGTVVRSPPN